MKTKLDIYVRVHGGLNNGAVDLSKFPNISLYSYCKHGELIFGGAADDKILQKIYRTFDEQGKAAMNKINRFGYESFFESLQNFGTETWADITNFFGYTPLKRIRQEGIVPNYVAWWSDSHKHIMGIILSGSDGYKKFWSAPRNWTHIEAFPTTLLDLMQLIADQNNPLGKIASQYSHVNIYWLGCRPDANASESDDETAGLIIPFASSDLDKFWRTARKLDQLFDKVEARAKS
jgi:hypothetical protein